jgi:hypothetical protein
MPYTYTEPAIFTERSGVTVWHMYDEMSCPMKYWFTTDAETADEFHGHGRCGNFDARLFACRWATTPTIAQWEDFWKPRFQTEDEAVAFLIHDAIDTGRIHHCRK